MFNVPSNTAVPLLILYSVSLLIFVNLKRSSAPVILSPCAEAEQAASVSVTTNKP